MSYVLRPYQEECIKLVIEQYEQEKNGKALLVLPTGSGKTIIFSTIINKINEKYGLNALIIAHRDELLDQAADKYRQIKPNAIIGKIKGSCQEYGGEVTVASIATVSRPNHIKRLQAIGYGLIIVDEAHHSSANGYQKVLEALPDAFVLGVTATPDRLDKKTVLGGIEPLYSASIIDMIKDGYLCDIKAVAIRTETNLNGVKTTAGDYNLADLETAIDTPKRNKRVLEAYQEHASGRCAIGFAVTVAHAQSLSYTFNDYGIPSGVITGDTPTEERHMLYEQLRTGAIKVLWSVNVLSEGFDMPEVDCCIMARPTQSRAFFIQAIGRALRLLPGKENAIILDLTDNCLKHRLQPQNLSKALNQNLLDDETVTEALAREEEEKKKADEIRVCKLKERRHEDISVDLLEKLEWVLRGDSGIYVMEVGPMKHRIALVPDTFSVGWYSVNAKLAPDFIGQWWSGVLPLEEAQQLAEKKARMLLAGEVGLVDRNAPWRAHPASPAQLAKLDKFHIWHNPDQITKGEASDLLDAKFAEIERRKKAKESA